jgi:hypothetical protein
VDAPDNNLGRRLNRFDTLYHLKLPYCQRVNVYDDKTGRRTPDDSFSFPAAGYFDDLIAGENHFQPFLECSTHSLVISNN